MTLPTHSIRESAAYRVATSAHNCSTTELLAVILGGQSADQAAQSLVKQFGSLHAIVHANQAELIRVPGIGHAADGRLRAALEISQRMLAPTPDRQMITTPSQAAELIMPLLMHREQEYLYVILLDTRQRVIGEPVEVYHGSLNTSLIRVGEVFREAIRCNAFSIIVAHNHPSGDPSPSVEDQTVTAAIVNVGKVMDIHVVDHIITGAGRFVSLKERGVTFNA